jgi:hypothetical protein
VRREGRQVALRVDRPRAGGQGGGTIGVPAPRRDHAKPERLVERRLVGVELGELPARIHERERPLHGPAIEAAPAVCGQRAHGVDASHPHGAAVEPQRYVEHAHVGHDHVVEELHERGRDRVPVEAQRAGSVDLDGQ